MAIWGAVITGVVSAGAAYVSSKNAKKNAEQANKYNQSEYQARLDYEREKIARKQNSMGAGMAPFLADQMLHVYGEQSKGRGGFNLDIDAIRKAMHLDEREAGNFYNQAGGNAQQGQGGVLGGASGSSYTPYNDGALSGRSSAYSPKLTNEGRKNGSFRVVAGNVDPEIEGYNGKSWDGERYGSVDGDPFAREQTHGMGNVTTQTERGYTTMSKPLGNGSVMTEEHQYPVLEGDLATGGTRLMDAKDIQLPDHLVQKLGLSALKAGASTFVPGIGLVTNIAGKFVQRFGKSNGKQSWWETAMGIKDANYGGWSGKVKKPDLIQLASTPSGGSGGYDPYSGSL